MTRLMLAGCTPEPLAAYVESLAVLRLVAQQADAAARGFWRHWAGSNDCWRHAIVRGNRARYVRWAPIAKMLQNRFTAPLLVVRRCAE